MSYTPTNWQTDDTVTAERLNKMEQGIEAAAEVYVINLNADANGYYLDSTEARDLFLDILPQYGKPMCFAQMPSGDIYPASIYYLYRDGVVSVERIEVWDNAGKTIFSRADIPSTGNYYGEVDTGVFTVALTPTAQDFSGTVDKTPAEIYEAFIAKKKIQGYFSGIGSTLDFTVFKKDNGSVVCQSNFIYDVSGTPVLISILTSTTDQSYSTQIFPLTPMS